MQCLHYLNTPFMVGLKLPRRAFILYRNCPEACCMLSVGLSMDSFAFSVRQISYSDFFVVVEDKGQRLVQPSKLNFVY
jgi:hypothetical protein